MTPHVGTTSPTDSIRTTVVALSAVVAVLCSFPGSGAVAGTPISEAAGGALSADATAVAPGGAAFSIWTLIYVGLIALAVWQALPQQRANPRQRQSGWWIAASMLLNAAWILAVQVDLVWLSVVVIAALLGVLARVFVLLTATRPESRLEAVVVDGTMFVYLGWVAVATGANIAAALQADRLDPLGLGADTWAVIVLALVAVVSVFLAVVGRGRLAVTAAIVWGLLWIALARIDSDGWQSTPAAVAAAVAAVVAAVSAVVVRTATSKPEPRF
ncbi:tryptophan-rich sensory protein [Rhodococcus sp. HM1]|uniref:TspO/MBR family protein n=1 Tax=Rhodococcus sp. HM1 TaxID=2937759 RepID=UPI00200B7ADA|nr:TspO/MBR family protein [Rhodococcus sp. HM1]MCK8670333.1 tryptophan-rich sensory protein [Rhodococcus sp. HM1]